MFETHTTTDAVAIDRRWDTNRRRMDADDTTPPPVEDDVPSATDTSALIAEAAAVRVAFALRLCCAAF